MNKLLIWLMQIQIKNGWMPRDLFYGSARLFGEACLELYVYRHVAGREQMYLLARPDNDPFYPGMLHLPGVRKIPSETDADHLRRALKEVPFNISPHDVKYVASVTYKAKRGTEYADIRRVSVGYNASHEGFYDVDKLPRGVIAHHVQIIKLMKG